MADQGMTGIHMEPGATTDAMSLMATAGKLMGTDWGAVTTELTGLVGQLGQGELGSAFLAGYQQLATDTGTAVDRCCQVPGQLAELGTQSVGTYVTADDRSHDHLSAVEATTLT